MSSDTGFVATAFPSVGHARERTTDIEADARSRGHVLGYAAGLRRAEQEWAERRAALEVEAVRLADTRSDAHASALRASISAAAAVRAIALPVLQEAGEVLTASAVELAEAIIGRELSDPLTAATAAVERVLVAVAADLVVELRMHPADAALLAEHSDHAGGLAIVADPAVERGEATATLPDGFLDAGIRSALDRARRILLLEEGAR
ncbi:FliH/SctL family protein [Leifsonia sp. YIM 134122]|uniref:FliH/SctL family protein n=1 Tax=Leifsonia stereocauli TaxID=3134136 RepID=A0ABU9W3I7_9MICO